jgi:hypothetical protein
MISILKKLVKILLFERLLRLIPVHPLKPGLYMPVCSTEFLIIHVLFHLDYQYTQSLRCERSYQQFPIGWSHVVSLFDQ